MRLLGPVTPRSSAEVEVPLLREVKEASPGPHLFESRDTTTTEGSSEVAERSTAPHNLTGVVLSNDEQILIVSSVVHKPRSKHKAKFRLSLSMRDSQVPSNC